MGSTYNYPPPRTHHNAGGATAAPPAPQYFHSPSASGGKGGTPFQWNHVPLPLSTHTSSSASSPIFCFPPLPSGAASHDGTYSPTTPSPDEDYNYDGLYDDNPLADDMEDHHMGTADESFDNSNTISLNSPPRPRTGKKCQDPSTPPSPSATSQMPQTSSTPVQHDHSSFKSHVSQVMMHNKTKSSSAMSSRSYSLGHSRQLSSQASSSTMQTSVSMTPVSTALKCLWMEICEQIDMLNNNLDSMHSDKLSIYQLKNE
jgi:hypothetical protein